ncbi:histone-arginine methyltransferase CARM1, putative [Pediculus humanus corporis]|uniref:type I protein arginine methyltransferase n=1 Tax=Pediculus humanus subsp. corporis TaxID=121224 RepID=E0VQ97_PEDHC|nr:histone-arginine methyltransferase CARM1, putative [Pediculus humanus corporis]EEB15553.1 histone-arginine methyltransferase CARM1, putative [Pediculus humanus corporis]
MATTINVNSVNCINSSGVPVPKYEVPVKLVLEYDPDGLSVKIKKANESGSSSDFLNEFIVTRATECARLGKISYTIVVDNESLVINFVNEESSKLFHSNIVKVKEGQNSSVFTDRTDESSASQYFQFYGYLSQQQNMLQDFIRTSTYQKAILGNYKDFQDKVVLDVGAGSGILSFFAAQAGASRVYAVEASSMANHAQTLVTANGLDHIIKVIPGKIEELALPEQVDVIVSEPMGYMLINERMLETYLHAKKFLKPGGKMFPCQGELHVAPFQDETLYTEQFNKASFWYQNAFHNVDLRSLRQSAHNEYFRQPIVDTFDIRICTAKSVKHIIDFRTADESSLHKIEIPLTYQILEGGSIHGLAFWFDVLFSGSGKNIWLSTSPTEPLTHWYQVRCLFEDPLFVGSGDIVKGFVSLVANKRQSYDVTIQLQRVGSDIVASNTLDLKNPYFRYSGTAAAPPPGSNTTSPSEAWWNTLDERVSMTNGISVNGLTDCGIDPNNGMTMSNPPNIHPGSITSTGRQRVGSSTATSTQQAQLIGGGISPTLFTSPGTGHQIVMGNTISHYPVSSSLMIGDYFASGVGVNVLPNYRHAHAQ